MLSFRTQRRCAEKNRGVGLGLFFSTAVPTHGEALRPLYSVVRQSDPDQMDESQGLKGNRRKVGGRKGGWFPVVLVNRINACLSVGFSAAALPRRQSELLPALNYSPHAPATTVEIQIMNYRIYGEIENMLLLGRSYWSFLCILSSAQPSRRSV